MNLSVRTKDENYVLYQSGFYGNKIRTWETLEALRDSGYRQPVVLRYKQTGSPFCAYDVPQREIDTLLEEWERRGARRELVTFNESAPDDYLILQGEVMRCTSHYTLHYATVPGKMREAMKHARSVYGLEALGLLRWALTPSSYEDLQAIFDLFPQAIVEFSAYRIDVGCIPGRNTLIWEVREY